MRLSIHAEDWPLIEPFNIANCTYSVSDVIVVEVEHGGHVGRGEAAGVDYLGETQSAMLAQIDAATGHADVDRLRLLDCLPAGGARNALDCALLDLESKMRGERAWTVLNLDEPAPRATFVTISLDAPQRMAAAAAAMGDGALIKLKLGDPHDLERLRAVRAAAPHASIIVDANGAWSFDDYVGVLPALIAARVTMIEQPLAVGDWSLRGVARPIAIFADESCQAGDNLSELSGAFDGINIKLDKTGGLTAALDLARTAKAAGLRLMVGCMQATSLAIAPAFLLSPFCEFVDLDWHYMNRHDRLAGMTHEKPMLRPFARSLWG